jgi:diguanylate cyclase (GGDEF)-like protein
MSDAVITILVEAAPEQAGRWAELLGGMGMHVWVNPRRMPPHTQPEVVLTTHDASHESQTVACELGPGVVRVGAAGQADAMLPSDASDREVLLACRLVAQIARLRRQLRSGQQLHEQLSRAALTDPLTGLPNRRAWDAWLPQRLASATTTAGRLCVALIDLDHFKRVNDELGHAAGDQVLRAAAHALREGLRHDDLLARIGGDEFAALVQVPNATAALAVVDRVRRAIAAQPAAYVGRPVTASAGFHLLPAPPDVESNPDAFLVAADAVLREAKRQGRDRTLGASSPTTGLPRSG